MRCNASRSGSDGTDSRSAETAKGTLGCGSESGIVTVLFHGNYFGRRNLQLCGCRLVYHRGRCGAASFRYGVRRLPRLRACVCAAAVRSAQVEGITCFFSRHRAGSPALRTELRRFSQTPGKYHHRCTLAIAER